MDQRPKTNIKHAREIYSTKTFSLIMMIDNCTGHFKQYMHKSYCHNDS